MPKRPNGSGDRPPYLRLVGANEAPGATGPIETPAHQQLVAEAKAGLAEFFDSDEWGLDKEAIITNAAEMLVDDRDGFDTLIRLLVLTDTPELKAFLEEWDQKRDD